MRIGIDIDDTITDTSCLIEQIIIDNNLSGISGDFDSNEDSFIKKYEDLIRNNIDKVMINCPIKKDARDVIGYLKNKGHQIYIITARNNFYSDNIRDITLEYLKKNDIIYDEFLFGFDDKKDICITKKIDVMLDDNLKLIETLKDTNVKGILFESNYNKKYDGEKVTNWLEFKDYINNWRN